MTSPFEPPLKGVRVVELTHTILGPSCGMILADLGAEVIKVEPVDGDRTRKLRGFGAGFFGYFNRNKKSLALDADAPEGRAVLVKLLQSADVMIENFAPGSMAKRGLGPEHLEKINPRLVYCALKGFLPGPYEKRPALDEVVQMMGGLAYMTGPSGRPLRAGTSVVDIVGGMFGAFGTVLALKTRDRTGKGGLVESALFESVVFLMGQHLAITAINGTPPPPMPERVSSWAVYEIFDTADGQQVFIGITSDGQWKRFCDFFKQPDLAADPRLATNNQRIEARPWLVPKVAEVFKRSRPTSPSRRSPGRRTCSTIRTFWPTARSRPRPYRAACRPACRCCRSRCWVGVRRSSPIRRRSANTTTRCWRRSATTGKVSPG
jgi:crotonobetainyl-CoA:carnitine CoA-transferase CaiB-like acyl-CoA transferase